VDDGVPPTSPLLKFDLLSGGPTVRSIPFQQFTKSGVWGKPSKATPEKGHAILDAVVPIMKEILSAHWPDSPGLTTNSSIPEASDSSLAKETLREEAPA
jgi:hypothetical protein